MSDLRVMLHYLGTYRRDFVAAALLMVCEGTLELLIPFLTASLIDEGIVSGDLSRVWRIGATMLVCGLCAMACGMVFSRLAARASMGLAANLRQAQFEAVQSFAWENLDEFGTSALTTRMMSDVGVIQNALMSSFRPMMRGPVMFSVGLILASRLSLRLALVFFVLLPLLACALVAMIRRVAPLYHSLQASVDKLNEAVEECVVGVRAIRAFVREDWAAEHFRARNDALTETSTRTFSLAVLNTPLFQTVMYSIDVLVLLYGGSLILQGELSYGTLTAFMSYVLQITNSLMMISNVFLLMTRALGSMHRVSEVLRVHPALAPSTQNIRELKDSSLEFQAVSFKYHAQASRDVLHKISLRVPAHTTLGILGATGSGKTALISLIGRFYDVCEGVLLVGGHDVRSYDLACLRGSLGYVAQTSLLFSGTIRDNLLWGSAHANDDELWQACHVACADEFVLRMGGLDAVCGQAGAGLSGGQKQRLALARALVRHPKILILDDALSAVDMACDATIRARLAELGDMTKIIVAQRIASVMDAENIAILDDGELVAQGNHEELLVTNAIYQELYRTQMLGGGL